jgi:zinc D-Ala-D-Ala carboxypeptidase
MDLSPHFTLEELVFSQSALRLGIMNEPDEAQVVNLRRLCEELLEPARDLLEVPLHINSGYRSPNLNAHIGGANNSAHMDGRAADFVTITKPGPAALRGIFEVLRSSTLPFDQLILECDAWIHMSVPLLGVPARRQVMTAAGRPGAWRYQRVDGRAT